MQDDCEGLQRSHKGGRMSEGDVSEKNRKIYMLEKTQNSNQVKPSKINRLHTYITLHMNYHKEDDPANLETTNLFRTDKN